MTDTTKAESLHDRIMRLPCTPPKDANINQMLAYKSGHREEDEPCAYCGGTGLVSVDVAIDWTTVKAIYAKAVEHFAPGETAAPDLLLALEELDAMYVRAWDTTNGVLWFSPESAAKFEAAHEKARAAIAKATGQA